jgi:hypothetical protein
LEELCKHVVAEFPDSVVELDARDETTVTLYLTQNILRHYAVMKAYRLEFGLQVRTSLDTGS